MVLGDCRRNWSRCNFQKEVMITAQQLGIDRAAGLTCAFNRTRGVMLATKIKTAESFDDRRMGLLNRDHFPVGEGLHIVPCDSIHTVGMSFSIDVAFLDENGMVLETVSDLQPGMRRIGCDRAVSALELPCCVLRATGTRPGDLLEFAEVTC
jgi:hypothetical protein